MTELKLSSLLDMEQVNMMVASMNATTGLPFGLYEASSGLIIAGNDWPEICTLYHRANSVSLTRCTENELMFKEKLSRGELCSRQCVYGFWRVGGPVMVGEKHVATLFCGQFLLEEDAGNMERFEVQAAQYGFDLKGYMHACSSLPVLSRKAMENLAACSRAMTGFLGSQAEKMLLMDATAKAFGDSHSRYRELFNNAPVGILLTNGEPQVFDANPKVSELTGFTRNELCTFTLPELIKMQAPYCQLNGFVRNGCSPDAPVASEGTIKTRSNGEITVQLHLFVSQETGFHTLLIQDIRERKEAEASLQRSREELERMVDERTTILSETVATLKRRNFESETISRVGELLQACETEQESYGIISSLCRKLFPEQSGYLAAYDEESDMIRSVAGFGDCEGSNSEFEFSDCWAIRRGAPHLVRSPKHDPPCRHTSEADDKSSLCVPVGSKSEFLGLLHLYWKHNDTVDPLCEREFDAMTALAKRVVELYALSLSNVRLRARLRLQSIRDSLTALYNRRYMEDALRREIARARRSGGTVSVILLDVDHFKTFNDDYGHELGDEVLRRIADLVQDVTRDEDIPCRYGGEEFLVILPGCAIESGLKRAEEIRKGVEQLSVFYHGRVLNVSVSLGVAAFPKHGSNQTEVVMMADNAMYHAKQSGRNCVKGAPGLSASASPKN